MKKLIIPTLRSFLIGAVALGTLLFLPAWTFNYWQAWVFILVFNISVNAIGVYLSLKDPELLERRKKFGAEQEQRTSQKIVISIAVLGNLAMLVFSALDYRLGWSQVPGYVSILGDILVALGLYINLVVFKENSYGGLRGPESHHHWSVRPGPASHVRGSPGHGNRRTPGVGLLVGSVDPGNHAAGAGLEDPGRGKAARERPAGLHGI